MVQMLETTRDKVNRIFSAETRAKIENAGLMVVDKADFEMVMAGYYEAQHLKGRVKQMEVERSGAK
jgi:hypothetical protein